MTDKTSTQLAEFVAADSNVTVGKNNTPGVKVDYKRLDGEEPGKAQSVTYIKGKIPEESRQLLSKLKAGDKFVVVKVKKENDMYFNLSEFRDASTWVAPPPKKPYYGGKSSDNGGDKPGATAGGVLHDAVALCVAEKKTSTADVLIRAKELIDVHKELVKYFTVGTKDAPSLERLQQEEQLANEQHNRDLDDDIDF